MGQRGWGMVLTDVGIILNAAFTVDFIKFTLAENQRQKTLHYQPPDSGQGHNIGKRHL